MLRNRIYLFLLTFVIVGGIKTMAAEENLTLSLNTDKETYKVGDIININYKLKNDSEEDILITTLGLWAVDKIKVFDGSGQEMQGIKLAKYSVRMIPKEDDFKTIRAKDSFLMAIKVKVKYGTINIGTVYKGLYLDFNDSCILLPNGEGIYMLKGIAKGNENWRIEGEKRYGFTNIWSGEIESNEVKIKIIK